MKEQTGAHHDAVSREDVISQIFGLFADRGDSMYAGEPVSQTEHALQAAALAAGEGASSELIVAALLHDIGHLLSKHPEDCAESGIDDQHEKLGAKWLEARFGPDVTEPVRLHVPAKRYLCAVNPDYLSGLSSASLLSLDLQGGPFDADGVKAFEALPHAEAALRLRSWDEAAKVPNQQMPGLSHYRPHLEECLDSPADAAGEPRVHPDRAPAPCIAMERMVSIHEEGISVVEVPLRIATQESLAGFGRVVTSFADAEVEIVTWPAAGWRPVEPGTGNEGGITSGAFEVERVGGMMQARNHAVDGHYVTGWFTDPASATEKSLDVDYTRILVREANYHPDGGQIFSPRDRAPFVALLALPGDDITPQDFVAFYCDGSFGIHIHPNVWHQPLFPVGERIVFDDKQGRVHACVACDFVKEFGVYLSVPLVPDQAKA